MEIIIPVVTLAVLGLIFGAGLAIASKKFTVHMDSRLEKVHGLLPGANCGACGGAGCFGFAEALLSGKLGIDACRVNEEDVKKQIAVILGVTLKNNIKTSATLHCNGGKKVKDRFLYKGKHDCITANLVFGGQKECVWGCLGFGSCVTACPFDAIKMSDNMLPVVDKDKCRACKKCVEACPKKLFSLVPESFNINVACSSHDSGKDTRAVCQVGCIACRKCEQVCPVDAITVIDNLAVIDYNKCNSCGECVKACPMKTILM